MIDTERSLLRNIFLKQIKSFDDIQFLASDMSKRTYYRVFSGNESFVLMDAPDNEELQNFIKIQELLLDRNIKAPKKYFEDLENGFLLIEDFGDITLTKALADETLKKKENDYYKKSIRILHDILERCDVNSIALTPYGIDVHLQEVAIFLDFYFLFIHQKKIHHSVKQDWLNLWKKALLEALPLAPNTFVLRDYHIDNIILLKDENLGILDFQDALLGSITYDYISLVEDARRVINEHLYKQITVDFLSAFDTSKHKDYLQNAAVIGACRHAKILGVFTRYDILYKNNSKLIYLPHVLKLLINALKRSEQTEILYFLKDQGFLKGLQIS